MELLTTGTFDAVAQVKRLGSRLLAATIILMLMSVCLAFFDWSENVEIIFFLSAWLLLIISENKAAFLKD
jgi:ABC-type polysaccharide/polyol phosphate export permease